MLVSVSWLVCPSVLVADNDVTEPSVLRGTRHRNDDTHHCGLAVVVMCLICLLLLIYVASLQVLRLEVMDVSR